MSSFTDNPDEGRDAGRDEARDGAGEAPPRGSGPAFGPPGFGDPMNGPLHKLAKSAWQIVLLSGVAALVIGILVLIWPGKSLLVAGVLFGIYLVITGITQVVAAFGTHGSGGMRVLAFISGAVSILLGLFCFRGQLESIMLLALWIGIGWLFRGITQVSAAASDPAMPARGWQVFYGIVSALAGIVLIVSPLASVAVLALMGGIWLVVVGVFEIATAIRVRHHAKNLPPHA